MVLSEVVHVGRRVAEVLVARVTLVACQVALSGTRGVTSRASEGHLPLLSGSRLRGRIVTATNCRVALLALGRSLLLRVLLVDNLARVVDVIVLEALTLQVL